MLNSYSTPQTYSLDTLWLTKSHHSSSHSRTSRVSCSARCSSIEWSRTIYPTQLREPPRGLVCVDRQPTTRHRLTCVPSAIFKTILMCGPLSVPCMRLVESCGSKQFRHAGLDRLESSSDCEWSFFFSEISNRGLSVTP